MMDRFNVSAFPDRSTLHPTAWAPLLLRPMLDSPEQFVVAVAAVGRGRYHVEPANRLDRLACIYGAAAEGLTMIVQASLEALLSDLATRGESALVEYRSIFSGVTLGSVSVSEAESPEDAAAFWMSSVSSLYGDADVRDDLLTTDVTELEEPNDYSERSSDRLPSLVLEAVASSDPGLAQFFNSEIRLDARRRRRNVHKILIDFAGSRLVANFGTLSILHYATSIDRLKRRMWDLKINRDRETAGLAHRAHELIVFRPQPDDPGLTSRQHGRIDAALSDLEGQADQEEIRLRSLTSVNGIASLVVERERGTRAG